MSEKWTPEQREALRIEGRPLRLALARQTPEEKAQQRAHMSEALNAEQVDHALHLWEAFALEVREVSTQMQAAHKDLAGQVRQLQDQHEHKDADDHDNHGEPLPAYGRA